MQEFKLGTNFNFDILPVIQKLNSSYNDRKITEVYGSIRRHAFYAARPHFRIPEVSLEDLNDFVKRLHSIGVEMNYTFNSIFPGSKAMFNNSLFENEFIKYLNELFEIGVDRITIANPFLLELIKTAKFLDKFKFEISTIAHIDTVSQIKYYYEKYGVDKFCGNLLKNRNFEFLKSAANFCNKNNLKYEVMVNEFCSVGMNDFATHCIYRDSCYLCHATNITKVDAEIFNGYPMNMCESGRNSNPANWLRGRWIRPEDVKEYEKIGINNFKITGRTGSIKYIKFIAKVYIENSFDGNLLQLWKPLETIYNDENELTYQFKVNIPNKSLNGFIKHWSQGMFNCENVLCEDCRYCDKWYKKIVIGEKR